METVSYTAGRRFRLPEQPLIFKAEERCLRRLDRVPSTKPRYSRRQLFIVIAKSELPDDRLQRLIFAEPFLQLSPVCYFR